jgi:hypothetical protein
MTAGQTSPFEQNALPDIRATKNKAGKPTVSIQKNIRSIKQ